MLQSCQKSLIYRAGPFCLWYPAHSEEKYAPCITGGKLPPKTVYFSLNKILKDKQQKLYILW